MDHYAKWRAMLRSEAVGIHEGEPICGFWRGTARKGDKSLVGIAIWPSDAIDGEFVAMLDRKLVPVERVWPFCAKRPVSEEAYREWERTGTWPDDHPVSPPAPGIGHNEPADETDALRDQIESASADVGDYSEIDSDEMSARAQSLRSRLLELGREADKRREAEKRPHLEAGKAIDARFQPLVKCAKAAADAVAKAMGAWETKKARAAAEAQRKAEEERRRREDAARTAAEAGKPTPAPQPDPDPEPIPPPATSIKGAYGRAASVKAVKVARVVDQDAAYAYQPIKTHPELAALIGKLAQRAVDAGHDVPGVTVEEERRVA